LSDTLSLKRPKSGLAERSETKPWAEVGGLTCSPLHENNPLKGKIPQKYVKTTPYQSNSRSKACLFRPNECTNHPKKCLKRVSFYPFLHTKPTQQFNIQNPASVIQSFVMGEVFLGVEGGGAALAGGGDGLAVDVVGDVAGGEYAGDVCKGAAVADEVAAIVHLELAAEGGGVRGVADGDEDALDLELAVLAGLDVFQLHGADFAVVVGEVFGDDGVPDGLDLRVRHGAVGHDAGGAEFVAAVDEVDLGGEAGEEGGFLGGGVAAADDADWDVPVERAVAGGAGGEAVAGEFLLAGEAEVPGAGAAGDDEGAGVGPVAVVDLDAEVAVLLLEAGDGGVLEACAEALGLGFHVHDELGAVDAVDEAGEVLDEGGGGELAAGFLALEDEGVEVCARCVDGCGEACAAGADDDQLFHREGELNHILRG